MIVKFIGASDPFYLLHGKEYYVIAIERGWDRIVDETGEDYLYFLYLTKKSIICKTSDMGDCDRRFLLLTQNSI